MEKLENILKKGSKALGIGLLTATALGSLGGCYTTQNNLVSNSQKSIVQQSNIQNESDSKLAYLKTIKESARTRGYLTPEESKTAIGYLMLDKRMLEASDVRQKWFIPYALETMDILVDAVKNDKLPFKSMFYLSLEKKDYDSAESVRREWVAYLNNLKEYSAIHPFQDISEPALQKKIELQLEKLNKVGLTDSILVNLRREKVTALGNKDWDTAQKIQNLIESRTKELQPTPKQQVVNKSTLEPKTQTTSAQPQQTYPQSNQPTKVKVLPSYGAEDLLRAVGLLSGKTPSQREVGATKLYDILLGE